MSKIIKYDIVIGLIKGLKYAVLFALPVLVDQLIVAFPEIAQLTLGGLLVLLVNWVKIRFNKAWL